MYKRVTRGASNINAPVSQPLPMVGFIFFFFLPQFETIVIAAISNMKVDPLIQVGWHSNFSFRAAIREAAAVSEVTLVL